MRCLVSRGSLVAIAAGCALFGSAGAAAANTAAIGSTLKFPSVPAHCTGQCGGVQIAFSTGTSTLRVMSPANGTVTSWSVRSGDTGALYTLLVLRRSGDSPYVPPRYATVASSRALAPVSSSADAVHTYSAAVPISDGDNIGVYVLGGTGVPDHYTANDADVFAISVPFHNPDGSYFGESLAHELLLQATIEFCRVPNLHRLKKVPAKRALAAADCGVRVKKKETGKRRFRGKVLKQKKPAGTTAAPGTVVPIVIGSK
jgi:PASTA domain